MKLSTKIVLLASILVSLLWITSILTNVPAYSGETKPLCDNTLVKISYDHVEAMRILIYGSDSNGKPIDALHIIKLRIKQNILLSSIVEKTSLEIYSTKIKPLFNTYSVMREDSFREGVLSVLDKIGVLIMNHIVNWGDEEVVIESEKPYLVIIVKYVLRDVEVDLSSYIPSVIYYGRETPREKYLYEYVYRAENDSFYSILLKYFIENAIIVESPIVAEQQIYVSKGSLSYSGTLLSWIVTIVLSMIQPNVFKRLLYRLGISVMNLREIIRRLKLSILLSRTLSPRRGRRS